MYSDFQDKTVAITGGAAGIGEAMTKAFIAQGARVFLCDIDSERGKQIASQHDSQATFHRVDLRRENQVRQWIDKIAKETESIDVLINNAAVDPRIPLTEMTTKQWDEVFSLNIRAFMLTVQQAAPYMPRGGSIVNFSSITHHLSPAAMSAYVATKSGIIGLTRSLARELGPRHIRVNTLAPGWIMTERQLDQFVTPAVKRMLKKEQCIPELIRPEEIADVALFLASSASRAITGQELLADRGWAHH